jgi:bacteriocin biosynthesis cyclodehydratase domain-containing protein
MRPDELHPSAGWTLLLEDGRLIASAGADALYLLDQLDALDARALHDAWHADSLAKLVGKHDAALDALSRIGALAAPPPAAATVRFSVELSSADAAQAAALALAFDALCDPARAAPSLIRVDGNRADLVVLVRGGGTLLDAAECAGKLRVPHLFVDVAYHHTISLGPLVWPGETACLQCLAGRIRHGWGDPAPPPAPFVSERAGLIAALVREELERFAVTGSCARLVERTVSIDLATWATRGERVHRLPWCRACFPSETAYGTGAFALPWLGAAPKEERR